MKKEHLPLIIGISLPILMILFVLGSVYVPGWLSQPQTDFIYSVGDGYNSGYKKYTVQNGKIILEPIPATSDPYQKEMYENTSARIYYYDTEKDSSRLLSFEEAQAFTLNTETRSPDGYEVTTGNSNGDFGFIFGGGGRGWYLKGHGVSRKINTGSNDYYYGNLYFLGWVLP